MENIKLSVKVTEEDYEKIRACAKKLGITMAGLGRMSIFEKMQEVSEKK